MPDHRFFWLIAIFLLCAIGVVGFLLVTNHVEDYGSSPIPPTIAIPTEPPPAATSLITTQYQNPFEADAQVIQASNPFDTYQNPFDNLQ